MTVLTVFIVYLTCIKMNHEKCSVAIGALRARHYWIIQVSYNTTFVISKNGSGTVCTWNLFKDTWWHWEIWPYKNVFIFLRAFRLATEYGQKNFHLYDRSISICTIFRYYLKLTLTWKNDLSKNIVKIIYIYFMIVAILFYTLCNISNFKANSTFGPAGIKGSHFQIFAFWKHSSFRKPIYSVY